jgi:hypothetical protein
VSFAWGKIIRGDDDEHDKLSPLAVSVHHLVERVHRQLIAMQSASSAFDSRKHAEGLRDTITSRVSTCTHTIAMTNLF